MICIITHVSVLTEDGTILKDQTVDVTDGRFSKIAPASESSLKVKEPGKSCTTGIRRLRKLFDAWSGRLSYAYRDSSCQRAAC